MVKTAIFVEGKTELIFIRELLLRYFEYQDISLQCFTLFSKGDMEYAPYDYNFPPSEAGFYFQIINTGSDKAVLPNLLKREKSLWKSGFYRIIGFRDMYSEDYLKIVKKIRVINPSTSSQFIAEHQEEIRSSADRPSDIFFRFAIMETEAWLLALQQVFENIDTRLTATFIQRNLGFDLNSIDPEAEFFHPANVVEQIFELIGRTYRKKEGDIETVVSSLAKADYQHLLSSNKCDSFRRFFETIPTS
jgi:hypothetical protein